MNKVNKITAILTCILVSSFILAVSAGPVDADQLSRTLTVGSGSGDYTDVVSLSITVDNAAKVYGAAFTLTYDPDVFDFQSLEKGTTTIDNGDDYPDPKYTQEYVQDTLFFQANEDDVNGNVLVAVASAQELANTTLLKARFLIKDGTNASGTYPIHLYKTIITNPDAGYTQPTLVPVLSSTPAMTPNAQGYYPVEDKFLTTLIDGSILVNPYEIDTSSDDFSISVPTDDTIVQWTEDVVVKWPKPTMTGGDVLNGFVYKWNTSDSALDDDALNNTTNDGMVNPNIDPPILTKDAADFANDDSNYIRYLHIKTWYLDISAGQTAYSNDVVIGPINIDNVAPTGTVRITDDDGNDITTTYSASLNLQLSATLAPVKMYLSETDTRGGSADYAPEVVYGLINTDTGEAKTIHVWFEDGVGNISTAPATDNVTLLAPVSISPYNPTLDLATVSTQVFAVDGNDDPYDWEIIEETPDIPGDDVANFSGASTDTNSVTVEILNEGTFKLQATPTGGGTALTSGTITVEELSVPKTYSLLTNVNAIVLCRTDSGYTTGAELMSAIPNCVDLARWNVTLQGYESWHAVFNPYDLVVGEPYFVTVSSPTDFTISGTIPILSYSMLINVNAISIPHDRSDITTGSQVMSAIPNCVDLARWNVTLQGYESWHAVFNPYDVFLDEAYFITVSTPTTWP